MCPCKWLSEFFCKFSNYYAVNLLVFSCTYFPISCYVSFCTGCILAYTYMLCTRNPLSFAEAAFQSLQCGINPVSTNHVVSPAWRRKQWLELPQIPQGQQEKESPKNPSRKNRGARVCAEPDPPLSGGSGGAWTRQALHTWLSCILHPLQTIGLSPLTFPSCTNSC